LRQGDGERVGVNAECAGVAVGLGEAEPVGVGAGDVGDGLPVWAGVGDPDGVPDGDVDGVGDVGAGLGDRVGVGDLAGRTPSQGCAEPVVPGFPRGDS
jgi:hypothetical protein